MDKIAIIASAMFDTIPPQLKNNYNFVICLNQSIKSLLIKVLPPHKYLILYLLCYTTIFLCN